MGRARFIICTLPLIRNTGAASFNFATGASRQAVTASPVPTPTATGHTDADCDSDADSYADTDTNA
jgi:hypothetical protein